MNNMIYIQRLIDRDNYITGYLKYLNKNFNCKTLELPYKDNQRRISSIPKGKYIAECQLSLRLGKVLKIWQVAEDIKDKFYNLTEEERINELKKWRILTSKKEREKKLKEVNGRDNILIHSGNSVVDFTDNERHYHYQCDSEGCILIGEKLISTEDTDGNNQQILYNSKIIMNKLYNLLMENGGICELIINDVKND